MVDALSVSIGVVTGATILCATPMILGFGTAGIVAGSTAAAYQSSVGAIAAGSYFASL